MSRGRHPILCRAEVGFMGIVLRVLAASFCLSWAAACNTSSFSGATDKKGPATDPKPVLRETPAKPKKVTTPTDQPLGNNSNNAVPIPGSGSQSPIPQTANNVDTANAKPDKSLSDMLNGLLSPTTDASVSQPNPDSIIFGGTKLYHIGDGQQSGSTCQEQLTEYSVLGDTYLFDFEVKQANTDINVVVNKVCGVDYSDTNFIKIEANGQELKKAQIPKGADHIGIAAQGLAPGHYQLVIQSYNGTTDILGSSTDYDDFLVGDLEIQGTQPLVPGQVGVVNRRQSISGGAAAGGGAAGGSAVGGSGAGGGTTTGGGGNTGGGTTGGNTTGGNTTGNDPNAGGT